jgi:NAD(P)-dependent dehydrogenase (short-subunit alcohol dehydrogenase family)
MIDFAGEVVLVTGAGRGLGRLYALECARRGACVVVNDIGTSVVGDGRDAQVADSVVAEIEGAGGTAVASYDSVADPQGAAAIVAAALDRFGRLDAVISNAGIFHTVDFEDLAAEEWRRMLDVHLDGGFHLGQAAYREMKSRGGGRFVFVVSSAGLFGQHQTAHYAAAKAGLLGLANVIALEGEPHGIRANTVLPFGFSRMVTSTVGDHEQSVEEKAFLNAIDPELVTPLVVYLASRSCSVTHHNFSAGAGCFSRVFLGRSHGWVADPGSRPSADDIETHFADISATEPFTVPLSIYDEVAEMCTQAKVFG